VAREQLGWSQAKLADEVEVTRPYVSKLEAGKRAPSRALLRRLVTVLKLDAAKALGATS
jgi:transcriptional regulator with XRE-family HTH domain